MMQPTLTLPKQPVLKAAEDFFHLRREGIGFIEQMSSQQWTDYNLHDPGITLLEALCYALTDLAYRVGWDIKDLLTAATPPADPQQPFPHQAFFTARQILTVNPVTPDDFRRLLIDLDLVRNAWVFCKSCACELPYYAWCEAGALRLAYQKPSNPDLQVVKVDPRGLYQVLLELEADPQLGDLNDRKIEQTVQVRDSQLRQHPLTLELRFPAWDLAGQQQYQDFIAFDANAHNFVRQLTSVKLLKLSRSKTATNTVGKDELLRHWREVFYASFELTFDPSQTLVIENAALRLFGNEEARKALKVTEADPAAAQFSVEGLLSQLPAAPQTMSGFIPSYRWKLHKTAAQLQAAKARLQAHRNLDEDYCRVKGVDVQEVTVCADVEVAPGADLERVQAQIWFEIEQYLNPPVPFYTLQQLLAAGTPVEEIFNGPALENGFIKDQELAAAGLKTVLRTSDIINRLMDIEGVIAVNNLLLAKYDAEGNIVPGAADPTWTLGLPVFDPNKSSAAWLLFLTPQHQPRLYHALSRFLFYKNGLPFLPRTDEARDTLTQLRGEAQRPKIRNAPKDLPLPPGTYRQPEDYFPVQYSLPQAYGIGPEGLPSHAPALRRAQARQLKAYLLVFEQILGNALAQLAHTADLFSLDPAVRRTYFTRLFTPEVIRGYGELVNGLTPAVLEGLTETEAQFQERRNRFLDHLLARFGEYFGEYALLLTNLQGQQVARQRLIEDKISFLKAYPAISHDRGKAFDYTRQIGAQQNVAGLKRRLSLLLGYPDLAFFWLPADMPPPEPFTITSYQLRDQQDRVWLEGTLTLTGPNQAAAQALAFRQVIGQMILPQAYQIGAEGSGYRLTLQAGNGDPLGRHPELFNSRQQAGALRDELLGWSSNERALVVEHLLLRPKFAGDALLPACTEGSCLTCGAQDPYSFRLTLVLPGWTAPFNVNLEMRRFADRTIRQETPAHLLAKICWVGNDGFIFNPCDPVVNELADLLQAQGLTAGGSRPDRQQACDCAGAIYTAYSQAFTSWYADKTLDYIEAGALKDKLEAEFTTQVKPAAIGCSTVLEPALWQQVQALMVKYYVQSALYGWQFERFEDAWYAWLHANAAFDWPEERLQDRLSALLESRLLAPAPGQQALADQLCACAARILAQFGTDFYTWMEGNFKAGHAFAELTPFSPAPLTLCTGLRFSPGTEEAVTALLQERYQAYTEVSYRLWVLVSLLGKLRNTYPGATLHDCDEGSDQNPVRLGSTALGNYPLRRVLPASPAAPDMPAPAEAPGPPETPPAPERTGALAKSERPARPAKPEALKKQQQLEKPEKPAEREKPKEAARSGKPAKAEKPEKPEKPQKPTKPEPPAKTGRTARPKKPPKDTK